MAATAVAAAGTYDERWYTQTPFNQEWWDGWPIVKHPCDLMIYQEIIWQTQPRLIVETGTFAGGSALFMAHMLDVVGQHDDAQVITIDLESAPQRPDHPRITYISGMSSTDLRVLEKVRKAALGKKTMVVLDSDHREAHVLKELRLYSPLVSDGCYLIVEDTHPLSVYSGDADRNDGYPAGALRKWNPARHGFWPDPRRERFLFTQNPGGYLKKTTEQRPKALHETPLHALHETPLHALPERRARSVKKGPFREGSSGVLQGEAAP